MAKFDSLSAIRDYLDEHGTLPEPGSVPEEMVDHYLEYVGLQIPAEPADMIPDSDLYDMARMESDYVDTFVQLCLLLDDEVDDHDAWEIFMSLTSYGVPYRLDDPDCAFVLESATLRPEDKLMELFDKGILRLRWDEDHGAFSTVLHYRREPSEGGTKVYTAGAKGRDELELTVLCTAAFDAWVEEGTAPDPDRFVSREVLVRLSRMAGHALMHRTSVQEVAVDA